MAPLYFRDLSEHQQEALLSDMKKWNMGSILKIIKIIEKHKDTDIQIGEFWNIEDFKVIK